MKKYLILLLTLLALPALATNSTSVQQDNLAARWAIANYQASGDDQLAQFKTLVEQADVAVAAAPDDAGVLIWSAIIKSTYAGKLGGLGALGLVKEARGNLEQAMQIDDLALQGSAYTSLGALYYQVPGWPIGFGSDKKARALLEKAVSLNPDGLDSNFFYADFLAQQKKFAEARAHLARALNAAPRPGREVADAGRREEIDLLLAKIKDK